VGGADRRAVPAPVRRHHAARRGAGPVPVAPGGHHRGGDAARRRGAGGRAAAGLHDPDPRRRGPVRRRARCTSWAAAGPPAPACRTVAGYSPAVGALSALVGGADDTALHRLAAEIEGLAAQERFEDAARRRDRLAALVTALARTQRLAALAAVPELVGARPDGRGGWEVAVLRHGRLAAAGNARRGWPPCP
jgi:hypothetical protein